MIKYLGSKRRLLPVLGELFTRSRARTALDLFTGTTRVAQELKRRGGVVTAVDTARYSEVFADCWIATDAADVDTAELVAVLAELDALPGEAGYFTETFCVRSRFFQPFNGERIDAIRSAIARDFDDSPLRPLLLTSLLLAADRVDSTAGQQMAYIKQWSPRSYRPLELRPPELLAGTGVSRRGRAEELAGELSSEFAYLDPPYNQHRYFTNYHVYETLVADDRPEVYGVACKRVDSRDPATHSVFNRRHEIAPALARTIGALDAETVVLSYNDESWIGLDELLAMFDRYERVRPLAFDSARYIGARIGIHNLAGEAVGTVSHVRNRELLIVAGASATVRRMCAPYRDAAALAGPVRRSRARR